MIAENRDDEVTIIELDDTEKLGYALVELEYYDIPEYLVNYIDYETIGREYEFEASGQFSEDYFVEFL